jgi:adenylosuccinate synthase
MTNVTVVVGAQFGSEGKGAIVGHLSKAMSERDLVVRVAGPNAGHTAYDPQGREWKLRAVPVAAVTNQHCQLHIAAGSEIDLTVLFDELAELDAAGHRASDRLSIHPSATILEARHINAEQAAGLVGRVGSTGKGIGAARADRIMRRAATADSTGLLASFISADGPLELDDLDDVIIEGTQGYGLGLHTNFYPQVTSSDCRAIDFLAMAGISPWAENIRLDVVLVARVYPIRVAGNSGPLKGETTWDKLDLPEERTTVTKKIRRVGAWDQALVEDAIQANGGGRFHPDVKMALTMLDQLHPEMRDEKELLPASEAYVNDLEDSLSCYITLVGTGPNTVVER